jgi:hypothetical protein
MKTAYNFSVSLLITLFYYINFLNKKESMREFEIILFQILASGIAVGKAKRQFSIIKITL